MYRLYVYNGALPPKHWFQFADYTTIITALEQDNQLLSFLNGQLG